MPLYSRERMVQSSVQCVMVIKMTTFDKAWNIVKAPRISFDGKKFVNHGGECHLCGKAFNDENISYESKKGNAFCKGCYSQRDRVE